MKKKIKSVILRLPGVSAVYARYCFLVKRLKGHDEAVKSLKKENKEQKKAIDKLTRENAKKDKAIEKYKKDFSKQQQLQLALFEEKNLKAQRELELLKREVQDIKSQAEKKSLHDKNELSLIRKEIARNHTLMKNSEKELKSRINYKYVQGLHEDDYKKALTQWLYESVGEVGDLDNPRTFNEKIQWIKLHSDCEPYRTLADKYLVRDWVKEKIGEEYLIPLIGAWDSFDEIDFDAFPDKFVLKANHGCKYNYIVYDKSTFNKDDAKRKFDKWMKENFAWNSLELQYRNIPKKIIAEEYLENSEKNLNDYKIFCFNGKAEYIMFMTDRAEELKSAFYDTQWNLMPFNYAFPRYTEKVEKPAQLEEMLRLAGILAEGFPHVRVDFYVLNDGSLKFGEMTFTTSSGFCRWKPMEYNRILGDMIKLPGIDC